MKFEVGQVVVYIDAFEPEMLKVFCGDKATVLHVSESRDTLRVFFHRWADDNAPLDAYRGNRTAKYGLPYYVLRSYRFKHACMFPEGGDA